LSTWAVNRTPVPPHPFSHSAAGEGWVIVGGTGGHGPDGSIDEDAASQTRAAIATIGYLLEKAGSSWAEVVYVKPCATSREDAHAMDAVLNELLPELRPTSGALTICELADPRMRIELEAWARTGASLTAAE